MAGKPSDPQTPSDAENYDGPDRREAVIDRRAAPGSFERRRGAGIRRPEFNKNAEEGEMNPEQFLFIKAIDAYKRANDRPYPSWTEVLEVIRKLGYRKTMPLGVVMEGIEDWTEAPDAPAFPDSPVDDELSELDDEQDETTAQAA